MVNNNNNNGGKQYQKGQFSKPNQPKNKQNNNKGRPAGKNNGENNNGSGRNAGSNNGSRLWARAEGGGRFGGRNSRGNGGRYGDRRSNRGYHQEYERFPKFRDQGNPMYERDNWNDQNFHNDNINNQNFGEQQRINLQFEQDTGSNINNCQNVPNISLQSKAEIVPTQINPFTENDSTKMTSNSIPPLIPNLLPVVQPSPSIENSSTKPSEPKITFNIKMEKDVQDSVKPEPSQNIAKPVAPKPKSSSESSSDSSDSNISTPAKSKLANSTLKKTKQAQSTVKKEHQSPAKEKKVVKESGPTSSSSSEESSSSSDSDSSEEHVRSKKQPSEEEVICLGKIENIENLVDEDDSTGSDKFKKCLLCDKVGHISFHCQTICKNCNAKYHGLKDCPKPTNLSIVFQQFMQFCMTQSCNYNPDQKFNIDGNTQIPISASANSFSLDDLNENRKRKKSRDQNSPVPSTASKLAKRKAEYSDDSDSSRSDESIAAKTKKSKRRPKEGSDSGYNNNAPSFNSSAMPFVQGFNQPVSFGFNAAHGGMGYNPMLAALSQMMGYNPAGLGFKPNINKEM